MKKIELEIVALSHSITQTNNYAVVLAEQDGDRRLPIVIGAYEAQAIAVAMEQVQPSRPLTHDLIKNIFYTFDAEIKEVIITSLHEGIFYARLVCLQNGKEVNIDSRTSDALALAVRFECPIYTLESVLEQAGITVDGETEDDDSPKEKRSSKSSSIKDASIEQLQDMLDNALSEENYEQAAIIRDEMKQREDEA